MRGVHASSVVELVLGLPWGGAERLNRPGFSLHLATIELLSAA